MWSLIILVTLSGMESERPFFLNFYSERRTSPYMNWNRTSPRSGTKELPFQSVPDIELVVMKVKSMIVKGVSFEIILAR